MAPQNLFLNSGQHVAVRPFGDDQFEIVNPAEIVKTAAVGSWANMVDIAIKILTTEVRTNGGIPGLIFCAAEHYAEGIERGTITAHDEEFGQQIVALVAQLKAQ